MSTTLSKPKTKRKKVLKGEPNYMVILPPGRMISEKMFELGIDSVELAKRMEVSLETVEQLIRYEIPLTEDLAERLERATWMNARFMLRLESTWRSDIEYAMQHPEKPAYLGGKIINKPKKDGNKRPLKEPRR